MAVPVASRETCMQSSPAREVWRVLCTTNDAATGSRGKKKGVPPKMPQKFAVRDGPRRRRKLHPPQDSTWGSLGLSVLQWHEGCGGMPQAPDPRTFPIQHGRNLGSASTPPTVPAPLSPVEDSGEPPSSKV